MRPKLHILAKDIPGEKGERYNIADKVLEFVRNVDLGEMMLVEPFFTTTTLSRVPTGTRMYWVECREIQKTETHVVESIDTHPLHGRVWRFETNKQIRSLEKKIKEDKQLAQQLAEGCFYQLSFTVSDMSYPCWIFVYCDAVPESARERTSQLAIEKGGLRLSKRDLEKEVVEYGVYRFRQLMKASPPNTRVDRWHQH